MVRDRGGLIVLATLLRCRRERRLRPDRKPIPSSYDMNLRSLGLLSVILSCQATNGLTRKYWLQRSIIKFDDEGKHLRRKSAILRDEIDADNVCYRVGRIRFLLLFRENTPPCTRLGDIDRPWYFAGSRRNSYRSYAESSGLGHSCTQASPSVISSAPSPQSAFIRLKSSSSLPNISRYPTRLHFSDCLIPCLMKV